MLEKLRHFFIYFLVFIGLFYYFCQPIKKYCTCTRYSRNSSTALTSCMTRLFEEHMLIDQLVYNFYAAIINTIPTKTKNRINYMSWHWCNWINFGYYITESDCLKLTGKAARLIPKNTLHNNDANWFGSPNYVKFSGILFVRFSIDISVLFLKIGKETFIIQREIKGWVGFFFFKFCLTNAGIFTGYRSFEFEIPY